MKHASRYQQQADIMVSIKKVHRAAPWNWLRAGWQDLLAAPVVSLSYGLIFVAIGTLVTLGLWAAGLGAAAPVALSGFALVAPSFAVGIYQVSRAIEKGETPRFRVVISRFGTRVSQIAFLSLILMLLLMIWMRAAQFLLVALAPDGPMEPGPFIEFALSSPAGMTLLIIGTVIGALLAATAFAISAIAFPMLVDQEVDAITAVVASLKAVFTQPFVMMTWAWLIAFMTVAGSVAFLLGLAVTFPWIAHATWHAYKDFSPSPSPSASA
jgi:uncharacterized membrane protein